MDIRPDPTRRGRDYISRYLPKPRADATGAVRITPENAAATVRILEMHGGFGPARLVWTAAREMRRAGDREALVTLPLKAANVVWGARHNEGERARFDAIVGPSCGLCGVPVLSGCDLCASCDAELEWGGGERMAG